MKSVYTKVNCPLGQFRLHIPEMCPLDTRIISVSKNVFVPVLVCLTDMNRLLRNWTIHIREIHNLNIQREIHDKNL